MLILFASERLRGECTESKRMTRVHGARRAKVLNQRLDDLDAAPALDTMRALPGRCHELTGDRKGQLALDLDHPYRLILEPADEPRPTKPDGGLDWTSVRTVRILGVENYHG